jgi:hypothetical protein
LKEAREHCLVKQWFCSIKTARTHFRRFNLPHNMADQDQAQSVPHEGIDVAVIHYLHWALQSWNALARMLGIAELRGFRDGNGNAQWPFYYSTADDVAPERAGSAPARLNESLRDVFNSKREERSGEERDLPHLSTTSMPTRLHLPCLMFKTILTRTRLMPATTLTTRTTQMTPTTTILIIMMVRFPYSQPLKPLLPDDLLAARKQNRSN